MNIRYAPIAADRRLHCGHGEEEDCNTPARYYVLARIDGNWMWDGTCVCQSEECATLRLSQLRTDWMEPWADNERRAKP